MVLILESDFLNSTFPFAGYQDKANRGPYLFDFKEISKSPISTSRIIAILFNSLSDGCVSLRHILEIV